MLYNCIYVFVYLTNEIGKGKREVCEIRRERRKASERAERVKLYLYVCHIFVYVYVFAYV